MVLSPEQRGKHSAAFQPSGANPTPLKSQRTPKHSKAFVAQESEQESVCVPRSARASVPRPAQEQPPRASRRRGVSHGSGGGSHKTPLCNLEPTSKASAGFTLKDKLFALAKARLQHSCTLDRPSAKKQFPLWGKVASIGACGLVALACIGGAATLFAQNAQGGDWALAANAEITTQDEEASMTEEAPLEDTASLGITTDEPLPVEERLALLSPHRLTNAELGSLPSGQEPFAFEASTGEIFALSQNAQDQLAQALAPFESVGYNAGYLLVDIETGRGIGANLDQQVYGASAIKAPYILFMCQTAFPAGTLNFDTPFSEELAWGSMDGDLTLDDETVYPFMTLAQSSIVDSDNDAFRIIRANYESSDFRVWLDNLNLQDVDSSEWFPWLSARDLGKLWLEMYAFWETGTETAWWLETHCSLTDMSFVRAALMGQGLYPDVVVADKAGWINGWDPGYHCLTDGSIVTYNGRRYLLCAITDAPYDEYWESCFESLIATLFAVREELA